MASKNSKKPSLVIDPEDLMTFSSSSEGEDEESYTDDDGRDTTSDIDAAEEEDLNFDHDTIAAHVTADLSALTADLEAAASAIEEADRLQNPIFYVLPDEPVYTEEFVQFSVEEMKRLGKVTRTFSEIMEEVEKNGGNMDGLYLVPPPGYRRKPKPKNTNTGDNASTNTINGRPALWAPKRNFALSANLPPVIIQKAGVSGVGAKARLPSAKVTATPQKGVIAPAPELSTALPSKLPAAAASKFTGTSPSKLPTASSSKSQISSRSAPPPLESRNSKRRFALTKSSSLVKKGDVLKKSGDEENVSMEPENTMEDSSPSDNQPSTSKYSKVVSSIKLKQATSWKSSTSRTVTGKRTGGNENETSGSNNDQPSGSRRSSDRSGGRQAAQSSVSLNRQVVPKAGDDKPKRASSSKSQSMVKQFGNKGVASNDGPSSKKAPNNFNTAQAKSKAPVASTSKGAAKVPSTSKASTGSKTKTLGSKSKKSTGTIKKVTRKKKGKGKKGKGKKKSTPMREYINPFALFPVLSQDHMYPAFKFSNETIASYLGPNFYSMGETPMHFNDSADSAKSRPTTSKSKSNRRPAVAGSSSTPEDSGQPEDMSKRIYYHYPEVQYREDGTPKPFRLSQLIPYHVAGPKRPALYFGPYSASDEELQFQARMDALRSPASLERIKNQEAAIPEVEKKQFIWPPPLRLAKSVGKNKGLHYPTTPSSKKEEVPEPAPKMPAPRSAPKAPSQPNPGVQRPTTSILSNSRPPSRPITSNGKIHLEPQVRGIPIREISQSYTRPQSVLAQGSPSLIQAKARILNPSNLPNLSKLLVPHSSLRTSSATNAQGNLPEVSNPMARPKTAAILTRDSVQPTPSLRLKSILKLSKSETKDRN